MEVSNLSSSCIKTYDWCEWKWFLQYELKFQDEFGPSASLGGSVHDALEYISKCKIDGKPVPNPDKVLNEKLSVHDNITFKKFKSKLKKVTKGYNDLFNSDYRPDSEKVLCVEQYFKIPLEESIFSLDKTKDGSIRYLTISGFIDRIDKIDDDTIEIIDYKTGSKKQFFCNKNFERDSLNIKMDIQPRLYHMAARYTFPQYSNVIVTFIYIADGGPVLSVFCDEDIEETKQIIKKYLNKIRDNDDPQRDLSWKCSKMCTFGKNGVCQEVWEEKDLVGLNFVKQKYQALNKE
ncbi:MAG: hypothetical protein BAJALOKI3v1_50098 [Promethearchaeota archaeon]|nr:MAG: hypothetical protein BAJALOKI3v1_50098 [Candidatus Lokiarchaeota archaeon]